MVTIIKGVFPQMPFNFHSERTKLQERVRRGAFQVIMKSEANGTAAASEEEEEETE